MPFDFLKGRGGSVPGGADPLQSLREFVVKVEYGRHHTTFNIFDGGSSRPVVRMHKQVPYEVDEYFYVSPVAEPERLLGKVVRGLGRNPDGVIVGGYTHLVMNPSAGEWDIQQTGIGMMVGRRAGLTRFTDLKGLGLSPGQAGSPYHLEFSSDAGPSFDFSRRPGLTSDYKITIRDERVNRLTALGWTEAFNRALAVDWRKSLIDTTTNPLKTFGPEYDADLKRQIAAKEEAKRRRQQGP